MTNFYEELHLDKSRSVEEINAELNNLENTWKRREINNPEKATKILAMIIDAREAFKTEASKAQYDHELNAPDTPASNVDAEREANYQKWKAQAEHYLFENVQLDMAKEALRQASGYKNPDMIDADFFRLAALAEQGEDDQAALGFINKAILALPNQSSFHWIKSTILGNLYSSENDNKTALNYLENAKAEAKKALELSVSEGDVDKQIACLEILAELYSQNYNTDLNLAENYAKQAIALGDNEPDIRELLASIQKEKEVFQPYQGTNHPSTSSSSGHGCYIATAVYGSYDCPEVWTLRRYRDYKLSTTFAGRLFIKLYYKVSPILVNCFGNKVWFNKFWRGFLDRIIVRLRASGVSEDKYSD